MNMIKTSRRIQTSQRLYQELHREGPLAARHLPRAPRVHRDALPQAPTERPRGRRRQVRVALSLAVLHDVHRHLAIRRD